ncbi:MAG: hypothetical protein ACPHUL_08590, partial [Marinomonas gallaica]
MPNTSQELSNTNTASCLALKEGILYHMRYTLALRSEQASKRDWWLCLSLAVRDRIIDDMVETQARHNQDNVRRLYYLSMEYLMGRMLVNNV